MEVNLGARERSAVTEILKSRWLSVNGVVQAFEWAFGRYLDIPQAVAVSSGTAALHLALKVLGIKEGHEVLCPAFAPVAVANVIVQTGAIPVFVDLMGLDEINLSPIDLEKKITPRSRAIVAVHYGGFPCRMDRLRKIAQRNRLFLVKAVAQGPGSKYEGRNCGTLGDIGCFSLFANPGHPTGEGGMMVTDNSQWAARARLLRSHGMTAPAWNTHQGQAPVYDVLEPGLNYQLDDLRAALGLAQLESEIYRSHTETIQTSKA